MARHTHSSRGTRRRPTQTLASPSDTPAHWTTGESPLVGGLTADGCPIDQAATPARMESPPPTPRPATIRAAHLPTTDLGGASTAQVLKRYATDAVAVMFDCINQLRVDADEARKIPTERALAVAAMATKSAGSLAKDVIAFTVGHRLDVHVNIRSQEDVPRWEALPVAVRAKFEEAISQAAEQTWETPSEGDS